MRRANLFVAVIGLAIFFSVSESKADLVKFQDYCTGCDDDPVFHASQFGGLVDLAVFVQVVYGNHPVPPGYPTISKNGAPFFFYDVNLTGSVVFDLGNGSVPIVQSLHSVISGEYFTKQHYDLMDPGVFTLTISVTASGNEEFHDGYGALFFVPYSVQNTFTDTVTIPAAVPGPEVGAGASSFALSALLLGWFVRRRGQLAA